MYRGRMVRIFDADSNSVNISRFYRPSVRPSMRRSAARAARICRRPLISPW